MRLPPNLRAQLIEVYRLNLQLATRGDPQAARREAIAEIAAGYGVHPDRLRERLQRQAKVKPVFVEHRCSVCGDRIRPRNVSGMCSDCYGAAHRCVQCGGRLHPANTTGICARCENGLNDIWRAR